MPQPEILNVPPEEAVREFKAKGYHVGFDWRDTAAAEHLRSFTVAKAMRLDILQDIRGAVDRALAAGTTFETFHDELEPLLRRKGWWGRQRMTDPVTGESRIVQLGSPRRLRIIFDTNLRMSYARGRWERIERLAEARPWLRYVAVRDSRTRPEHMSFHGTVLPVDHPFWKSHYPPNGWRCRCTVIQLSDDDLEEFGFSPSDGPPPGWDETRSWENRRLPEDAPGRIVQVPRGIDPGFQHNVGLARAGKDAADRLVAKLDAADPDLAAAAIGRFWQGSEFRRFLREAKPDGDFAIAVAPETLLAAVGGRSRVVRLSEETAAKQRKHRLDPEDYARVQRLLDEGEWVQQSGTHAAGFIEIDGRLWRAVVKATADGSETYLVSLHRARSNDLRAARRRFKRIER